MKKLRIYLHTCESRLEEWWQKLSARKQKEYVILFFTGYLLLTVGVVVTVWYDAQHGRTQQKSAVDHIRNPALLQKKAGSVLKDSSLTQQKDKGYER